MKSISLKDFRCFGSLDKIPLKPLTLLIGENSTGKTAFLAAIRLASSLLHPAPRTNFNESPFEFGSFNEIARCSGSDDRPAQHFAITLELPVIIDNLGSNLPDLPSIENLEYSY